MGRDLFDIALMKKFGGGGTGGGGGNGGGASSWDDLGEDNNAVLLPPTQFEYDDYFGLFAVPGYIDFMEGKTYTVNWNGAEYTTEAVPGQFNGEDLVVIGNPAALGGANNNLPFAIACLMGSIGAIPLDGSAAVNVGIKGYGINKIPVEYMPSGYPYIIEVTGYGSETDHYECTNTVAEVEAAIKSGRMPIAKKVEENGGLYNYIYLPLVQAMNAGLGGGADYGAKLLFNAFYYNEKTNIGLVFQALESGYYQIQDVAFAGG